MVIRLDGAMMAKLVAVLFVIVSGIIAISAILNGTAAPIQAPQSGAVPNSGSAPDNEPGLNNEIESRFSYELQISKSVETMSVEERSLLVAETVPFQPRVKIVWTSSDPSVLSMTTDGWATGVSPGEATVTAIVLDNDQYNGPSVSHKIMVTSYDVSSSQQRPDVPAGNRNLPIANADNLLSENFVPRLILVGDTVPKMNDNLQLTRETLDAYVRLHNDFKSAGKGEVFIISTYRSYQRQNELFEDRTKIYINKGYSESDARAETLKTIQFPGASEHQLGLSIDLSTDGNTQHNFHTLPQGKWIAENCHKYGFIIRYPADKTALTGINFEPWHLRYVGIAHAEYMKANNLCLEEYIVL